ncbi:MAG: beta-ketoacyl-ACP synthase III [Cyanobacteria bacterium P01_H01_bin.15]
MVFSGCGSATPAQVLTNDALSQIVETSDEWIRSRTGIGSRHLLPPDQSLTDLAIAAGKSAIAMAGIESAEIDLVILATSTPDDLFGSASKVAHGLGATRAVGFDLTAACSGFVFAFSVASQFIQAGTYQKVLVIGADALSRWLDWEDRRTCVLFGDGAGAVVCQTSEHQGLVGFELYSDGSRNHCLTLGLSSGRKTLGEGQVDTGKYNTLQMNGREVYRFAVDKVPEVMEKLLYRTETQPEQLDWLVLHQANQRIMDAVAKRLKLDPERVISNLGQYGNTSAASIPIALDEAVRDGKIQPGDLIATAGFGAGLSWGAALIRWGENGWS